MRVLFLDLASNRGLVAIVTMSGLAAMREVDQRIRDHELVPLVEGLLREASVTGHDLTGIVCMVGPGGFTSIRVAVACTNAWSYAWGVPLAGIHLSDLWKARTPADDVLWIHSTKKMDVFVRGFGRFAERWVEPTQETLSSVMEHFPREAAYMGELIPEHEEHIKKVASSRAPSQLLADVLPAYVSTLSFSHTPLEPWYGREG